MYCEVGFATSNLEGYDFSICLNCQLSVSIGCKKLVQRLCGAAETGQGLQEACCRKSDFATNTKGSFEGI